MKLYEIMSTTDSNGIGRLINDARQALIKYSPRTETVNILLKILDDIDNDINIVISDEYSFTNYLQMLSSPTLNDQTIQTVYDALSSFQDSGSE